MSLAERAALLAVGDRLRGSARGSPAGTSAEKRSMNLIDCRSSTWKTTARSGRGRGVRGAAARCCRSRSAGSATPASAARPSAIASLIDALEDRDEQVVLALEVEVDGAGRDAGDARDVGDLRLEEAVLGEDLGGGAQDRVALVAARPPAAGRPSDAGRMRWLASLNEWSFSRQPCQRLVAGCNCGCRFKRSTGLKEFKKFIRFTVLRPFAGIPIALASRHVAPRALHRH